MLLMHLVMNLNSVYILSTPKCKDAWMMMTSQDDCVCTNKTKDLIYCDGHMYNDKIVR